MFDGSSDVYEIELVQWDTNNALAELAEPDA
jgi:hypothetical protein